MEFKLKRTNTTTRLEKVKNIFEQYNFLSMHPSDINEHYLHCANMQKNVKVL